MDLGQSNGLLHQLHTLVEQVKHTVVVFLFAQNGSLVMLIVIYQAIRRWESLISINLNFHSNCALSNPDLTLPRTIQFPHLYLQNPNDSYYCYIEMVVVDFRRERTDLPLLYTAAALQWSKLRASSTLGVRTVPEYVCPLKSRVLSVSTLSVLN